MCVFKQSTTLTGNYKEIMVEDGQFLDPETGEVIDLVGQLEHIYEGQVFSLTTKSKVDVEID